MENTHDRYQREREFTDGYAEKRLADLPDDYTISHVSTFEDLCMSIDYLRSVPDFLGDLGGKRVLELACGNGWVSRTFAKSGARVWAFDLSPKMIEYARRLAEAAGLDISFDVMVSEEMTYEDGFFDLAFMHMALHHCDIDKTARQIARVLKPGGKAAIVEDYAYHPLMKLYRAITPGKHTEDEHPLDDDELATFVSCFSSHGVEYSGLLNIFETTKNKFVRPVTPVLRRLDTFLYAHASWLQKFSRIAIVKVVK